MNGVDLIHDSKISVIVIVFDGSTLSFKNLIAKLIMASLFELQIVDSAAYLEKILYNIFRFTAVSTRLRINHQIVFMLSEYLAESFSCIINGLIVKEMHLLKDVNKVNLIVLSQVPFDDTAVFFVKHFDLVGFALFCLFLFSLLEWW